ncbi:HlyD family secretion protein [Pragia fontium]|uniref:HlyD family secretion protein n=1 Tax=Pragia fontium DSM 5563 = ATCC 49100 TaxID=1122977 RepID=A0AAJ4W9U0_9GAMM|nr:efflux RND transporter periplasmic adaptor subunit [Pragia fontium]SFC62125.1 HlyD family secretion protein [Pragia fontium DSM 5563 = ATCC 49100]SUB83672.1 putative efflux pump membrane fusion protein [Pragia fontium]VEJ56577.1 putative efflux pump membrane fusion protein [Pragia fontium]
MKKQSIITLLFIIVVVALAILFRAHNQYILLQGEVDAPEVLVTSKAKGRIIERYVERGDDVKTGQLLMKLDSPELDAQVKSLEAARDQAKARLEESMHGTREESIRNLKAALAQAEASYQNAEKDYRRNLSMAPKGYVSASMLDSSLKARDTALQQVNSARAQLDQAVHGDRSEQRDAFVAALHQAEQNLAQVKVQQDDLLVKAPVDGEVGTIPAEQGELLNASSPLLTIIRLPDAYFVYNLREDILAHVRKGDKVKLQVPALNNQQLEAEVRFIAPMGDFATKRATRATGDFDLKTFEVRLYPIKPVEGLRPGMSTLWKWED